MYNSPNGKTNGQPLDIDPITGAAPRPDGAGMYLYWDGRKSYRTRMPRPRVLEPVDDLSYGEADGNFVIEGDNLQAMVSLRSHYRASVDVAYVDPPYNTGKKDFRYSDRRFRDPNADSDDAVYVSNEDGGRHTKWLNSMGPRLSLVHELLADHGICFVSINDIEMFRLGLLMDEIFDERNRLGVIVWKQGTDNNPTRVATEHEYILCYAKRIEDVPPVWRGQSAAKDWMLTAFEQLQPYEPDLGQLEKKFKAAIREHVQAYKEAAEKAGPDGEVDLVDLGNLSRYWHVDERGPYAPIRNTDNPGKQGYSYDVIHPVTGKPCAKPSNGYRFSPERMRQFREDDRLVFGKDHTKLVEIKKYLRDVKEPLRSVIDLDGRAAANTLKRLLPESSTERFKTAKPVELIMQLIEFAGDIDALVLDPFAGSGTTAHAVLRLNERDKGARRFILIEEGTRDDRYCRTLTAPRIQAAIEQERLKGGFAFMKTGRKLNREAILDLERQAITSLIVQTDITGASGRGIARIDGEYVIGYNAQRQAICLHWNGRSDSTITREILVKMFEEAKALRLNKPLRVYGSTCVVGETESFRFCQIPDEILAALHLSEEQDEIDEEALASVEALEAATNGMVEMAQNER